MLNFFKKISISKSRRFRLFSLVFIIGIFVSFWQSDFVLENIIIIFLSLTAFFIFLRLLSSCRLLNLPIIIILALGVGMSRGIWSQNNFKNDFSWLSNDSFLEFSGYICEEPKRKLKSQSFVFCAQNINQETETNFKALLTVPQFPWYFYGDFIKVKAKLEKPGMIEDFDYQSYLARHGIALSAYRPQIEVLKINETTSFLNFKILFFKNLYKIKQSFLDVLNKNLEEPEASLARAMLLGEKNLLEDDLKNKFSLVGISHIIAISGMHIGIIIVIFVKILDILLISKKTSFLFVFLFLLLYVAIIGFPPSAIRASFMALMVLLAFNFGRLSQLENILLLAAVLMLLFNPWLLFYDIGFQLSFLAVLGIFYIFPLFKKMEDKFFAYFSFSFINKPTKKISRIVADIFYITTSAQISTAPILFKNFGFISWVAPISNLLVLWTLPLILFNLIIALPLSFLLGKFSLFLFLPAYFLLKFIILIAEILS